MKEDIQRIEKFIKNQKPFEEDDNKFWRENGINIRALGLENLSLPEKSRLLDFLEDLKDLNLPDTVSVDTLPTYLTQALHKNELTEERKQVFGRFINNLRSLGFTEEQIRNETHEAFIDILHEKGIHILDGLLESGLDKVNQTAYITEIIDSLKNNPRIKAYRESEVAVFEPIEKE